MFVILIIVRHQFNSPYTSLLHVVSATHGRLCHSNQSFACIWSFSALRTAVWPYRHTFCDSDQVTGTASLQSQPASHAHVFRSQMMEWMTEWSGRRFRDKPLNLHFNFDPTDLSASHLSCSSSQHSITSEMECNYVNVIEMGFSGETTSPRLRSHSNARPSGNWLCVQDTTLLWRFVEKSYLNMFMEKMNYK